jgi:glycosyltransferase involved in cell wall biosynthesis
MEATTITGVARALIPFYKAARAARSAEISLITFIRANASGSTPTNFFIDTIEALGFPVEVIPERNPVDISAVRTLYKTLQKLSPDIVETHAVKSHVLLRMNSGRKAKWVAFHHGYTRQNFKMRLYNTMNPWALRGADRVITVCRPFLEQLAESGVPRSGIFVLPNAIEPSAVLDRAPKRGLIVSIGRLSGEKGHQYLVDAMAHLQRKYPDMNANLVLVGDGPESANLQKQIEALDLSQRVTLAGHQSEIASFYAEAEVFALPSLSEGSPLVLLEAMLARTPIVATSVGGVPETVSQEHSALLVPPKNAEALADAIARLLTNQNFADQLAANAYHDVTTRHTSEAYCSSLMSIYRELIDAR